MTTFGYNDSRILLNALGTFWSTFFTEKDLIQKTLSGMTIDFENEYFRFCENVLALAVKDIPVFNRERWRNIRLLESKINVDTGNFLLYGAGTEYGNSSSLYGGQLAGEGFSFKLDNVEEINGFVVNRIYDPSVIMVGNRDFLFSGGVIHFTTNIFDNPLIATRNIIDSNNTIVDREASLWITEVHTDRQYLWKNYGSLFNLFDTSSEKYKTLLRSLLAIHMNGPKIRYSEGFVNAALGLPIIIEKEETIRHIITEGSNKKIVTDFHTYDIVDEFINEEIVIGATLQEFTPIHNYVTFLDNKRTPKWWISKKFFSVPQNLLDEGYISDILVKNKTIDVEAKIGEKFPLEFLGNVTPEKRELLENVPLTIGMQGLVIGQPLVKINYLDYVAGMVADNLVAIEYDPTKVTTKNFDLLINDFFANLIPVHCAFTILTEVGVEDQYDTGNDTIDEIEHFDGDIIVDDLRHNLDYNDGYFGLPRIGLFKINEPNILAHPEEVVPTPVEIGRPFMHKKPLVLLVKNNKC